MRKLLISTVIVTLFFPPVSLTAEEIAFPKSQEEIVQGLSFNNKKSVKNGKGYEVKNGKAYKVINGQRYRLRGINVVSASEILPRVGAHIHFDYYSYNIRQKSYLLLNHFGKALKHQLPKAIVIVVGHTDNQGTSEYNQELSEKRSQAVVNYLINNYDIDSNRLLVRGFGETQPIVSNEIDYTRYKNRRVEFIRIE